MLFRSSESYSLEYGEDTLEIKGNDTPLTAVLVDDVLATGGTFQAALKLCRKANIQVDCTLVLIDLKFLHQDLESPVPIHSLLPID